MFAERHQIDLSGTKATVEKHMTQALAPADHGACPWW